MASIERTAYPRFRRLVTARELAGLRPTKDDAIWARERSRSDEHLLALVVSLRCFQRFDARLDLHRYAAGEGATASEAA